MDPKVNYFVVGLFVVVLGAAVIFFTLWMTFGMDKQVYDNYLIVTSESVSGLTIEAPVKFNGVNVGTVTAIELMPNNPDRVSVEIAVKAGTPISTATRATMMSQGITGLTFVGLKGGQANSPKLVAYKGQRLPVILSAPSLLVRIDTIIQTLAGSLEKIDNNINYLLRKENQDSISEILKSVATITRGVADHQDAVGLSVEAMPLLVKNLSDASSSAGQVYNTISGQLNQGLLMSLNTVLAELQNNPAMLIRGRAPQPLGPGE